MGSLRKHEAERKPGPRLARKLGLPPQWSITPPHIDRFSWPSVNLRLGYHQPLCFLQTSA